MTLPTATPPLGAIDEFVRAYEAAWAREGRADFRRFLPSPGHPLYRHVVRELARIDIEHGWEGGRPRPLEDYRREYPEAFDQPSALQEVAFEEYRQRRDRGENPSAADYAQRYGVQIDDWPAADDDDPGGTQVAE